MKAKTVQGYLDLFAAGDIPRARGHDPAFARATLRHTYEHGGLDALFFNPGPAPAGPPLEPEALDVIEDFREWHMRLVTIEFDVMLKNRQVDVSYRKRKIKFVKMAFKERGLSGLLREDVHELVSRWDYCDNLARIARSAIFDLRRWYPCHSSFCTLLP